MAAIRSGRRGLRRPLYAVATAESGRTGGLYYCVWAMTTPETACWRNWRSRGKIPAIPPLHAGHVVAVSDYGGCQGGGYR
ncbi:hypothetical protein KCP69_02000 [Salmonella enterica subsp. enterica]|nr:hypothetical protein KCP69_02000 [Salmonella enterica subsp. enterica]